MAVAAVRPFLRRRAQGGAYAAWIAVLIAAYYAFPGVRAETWGLLCVSGIGAIVAGVVVRRPARRLPWVLLAAALSSFAAGQLTYLVAAQVGAVLPYPSIADGLYLSCYPLYALGLAGFIAARTPHGDRRALIDALTLTAGMALLSWTFLIEPYVRLPGLSGPQRVVAVAYPLGDILMLALLARLLSGGTTRARSVQLLTTGAVAVLVTDSAWGALQLHGTFHNGTVVDVGWAIFYSCWGAAALQPDMARLTEPVPRQPTTVSPGRLALLMLASLIAPVLLLTQARGRPASDVSVIAVFSGVLYLLVLARLWDAAASHRRALARERVVRQAGLSMTGTGDVAEIAAAVKDAVAALAGGDSAGDVLVGVRSGGTLLSPGALARPGEPGGELAVLSAAWSALGAETFPVLVPARDLPGPGSEVRTGPGWVLLCPLAAGDERPIGLIAVFGQRRVLADLTATLEILARQVALTLNSVMLRQEVIRQRNEAYFRALVQDASDAIVITGDDGTVKYATPSSAAIFGAEPDRGSLLWEVAAIGDQATVTMPPPPRPARQQTESPDSPGRFSQLDVYSI